MKFLNKTTSLFLTTTLIVALVSCSPGEDETPTASETQLHSLTSSGAKYEKDITIFDSEGKSYISMTVTGNDLSLVDAHTNESYVLKTFKEFPVIDNIENGIEDEMDRPSTVKPPSMSNSNRINVFINEISLADDVVTFEMTEVNDDELSRADWTWKYYYFYTQTQGNKWRVTRQQIWRSVYVYESVVYNWGIPQTWTQTIENEKLTSKGDYVTRERCSLGGESNGVYQVVVSVNYKKSGDYSFTLDLTCQ